MRTLIASSGGVLFFTSRTMPVGRYASWVLTPSSSSQRRWVGTKLVSVNPDRVTNSQNMGSASMKSPPLGTPLHRFTHQPAIERGLAPRLW